VITYRPRSALREMAKAVGLSAGHADALTKWIDRWGRDSGSFDQFHETGAGAPPVPPLALELAEQVLDFPRHLGIHSGGMVLADRPLTEVCPVEWARMENRSVLQWDKDDCAAAGLVKFDLLGLGMLTMLHLAVDLVREHEGVEIDLATIPQEPEVYALLTAADTIGVFQVESRAQMATLPRLRPEKFYDLVVEVALIRPGPIQGGSVHPYLRRRNGEEPVTYPHPRLEECLRKTLGVPLFQEQLMQMAIDIAGFSPGESDRLRQAMGSKRSRARMAAMKERLLTGMAERGITGEVADDIVHKIEGFADFGFPESHSVSFAYLVYSSSWIKLHYPTEFACALLNAQPMGFYSPHTIVRDATRHGVEVLGPCVAASRQDCTLEPRTAVAGPIGRPRPGWHADPSVHAMRVGLRYVRGLSTALLDRIDDARAAQPFADLQDFTRRTGAPTDALEALATAGAFACFDQTRRAALWAAGALRDARPDKLPGVVTGVDAPMLPGMTEVEEVAADLWATGLSAARHPTEFLRAELEARGIATAEALRELPDRTVVDIAGVVTHRQQPSTAKGVIFLNLEDETGLINVICTPDVWKRYRKVARTAPALEIRGLLERHQGVTNVLARRIVALPLGLTDRLRSRDFHSLPGPVARGRWRVDERGARRGSRCSARPVLGAAAGGDEQQLAGLVHIGGVPDVARIDHGHARRERDLLHLRRPPGRTVDLLEEIGATRDEQHHLFTSGMAFPRSPGRILQLVDHQPALVTVTRGALAVGREVLGRPCEARQRFGARAEAEVQRHARQVEGVAHREQRYRAGSPGDPAVGGRGGRALPGGTLGCDGSARSEVGGLA
jgi:error-prone DNA polymerase